MVRPAHPSRTPRTARGVIMAVPLPILTLDLPAQKYSCHACGNCCRDFTVQLRDEDIARLGRQGWTAELGAEPWVEFRGSRFLRQRPDGSCIFLQDDGLCRIHARYGLQEKPVACRSFPLSVMPTADGPQQGLNFACGSVQLNKGAPMASHLGDLRRIAEDAPETIGQARPVALLPGREASPLELRALAGVLDQWMGREGASLATRIDGLAWIAQALRHAKLASVKDARFLELVTTIVATLEDELDADPPGVATERQERMLRQAIFMRTEDPRLDRMKADGFLRTAWRQWRRQRAFLVGGGTVPELRGFAKGVRFQDAEVIPNPLHDAADGHDDPIDDLVTRWVRARLRGARTWGAGYYGFSAVEGLAALCVDVASAAYLARVHAAGRDPSANRVELPDMAAAVARIDRTAGRAPWLATSGERLRLSFLALDDGLRRTCALHPCGVEWT
jgi:lysine-N-methylase